MKKVLFLSLSVLANYASPMFSLFWSDGTGTLNLSSSYSQLNSSIFPIFTDAGDGVVAKIKKKKISRFGLLLDGSKAWESRLSLLAKAEFVIFIGGDGEVKNLSNTTSIPRIVSGVEVDFGGGNGITDVDSLDSIYELLVDGSLSIQQLTVLYTGTNGNRQNHLARFADLGVELRFYQPTPGLYLNLLRNSATILHPSSDALRAEQASRASSDASTSLTSLCQLIDSLVGEEPVLDVMSNVKINIVCFRPTYLFADLVKRFTDEGCINSYFPMENAEAYIWMRPQELWHYEHLLTGQSNKEINATYSRSFVDDARKELDMDTIRDKLVAIHHGTCYEPLYQFDYKRLATVLSGVKKVVGVCEFEECYGHSYEMARADNFDFVPIGYDHKLFAKENWKVKALAPKSKLKLGFVGRAYGTLDKAQLERSRLSEPKGYRKGGDILLDLGLRLKALEVPFEFHILGQNWEHLIYQFDRYGIDCFSYTRDADVSYKDFPSVYSKFDSLIIAARCEGGPVSAIEALSLGVGVISTDVGVVKFLDRIFENSRGCQVFSYSKKWHIADLESAVEAVVDLYEKGRSVSEYEHIRSKVLEMTTDNWVKKIIGFAK